MMIDVPDYMSNDQLLTFVSVGPILRSGMPNEALERVSYEPMPTQSDMTRYIGHVM